MERKKREKKWEKKMLVAKMMTKVCKERERERLVVVTILSLSLLSSFFSKFLFFFLSLKVAVKNRMVLESEEK